MSCAVANAVAREALEVIAGQGLARREGDRMQEAVEAAPLGAEGGEQAVDVVVPGDVAAQDRRRSELAGDLHDAVLEIVVDVGERELRAFASTGARDPVRDRAVRENAGDQDLLVGEKAHGRSVWRAVVGSARLARPTRPDAPT